ncbi:hypothetical protein A2U01_0064925, partial [Trifolium medium]|nr:hypothetical protein [Trifolium medium]
VFCFDVSVMRLLDSWYGVYQMLEWNDMTNA